MLSPFAYMRVCTTVHYTSHSQFPTFSLADAAVFVYNYTRLKHKKVRVFVSTKMCSSQHCQQALPHITSKKVSIPIHMMLFPCTQFLQGIHIVKALTTTVKDAWLAVC